ncbi:MAG TPA: DUF4350 domain-containing protein [Bacillota bacterium]
MSKHKVIMGLVALGLLMGILLFLSWVSLSQKKLVAYDANSYGPDGLKALDLILKKSGYQVTLVHSLPVNHQSLLILVTTTRLSAKQQKTILTWVSAGGNVLELASSWPSLTRESDILDVTAGRPFQSDAANLNLSGLTYHISKNWVPVLDDPEQGFYEVGDQYFIYRSSYGSGSIINWNDIAGLTNRYLKTFPDNAAVLVTLLRSFYPSGRVSFYNMAFVSDNSDTDWRLSMVFSRYWIVCLLALMAIILLIWKLAARFGRPRPLILARGRPFDEFVYSMAGLFQQAKIYQMVLDNLWRDLLKAVAELTHMPVAAAPEQLIAGLNVHTGNHYRSLSDFCSYFDHPTKLSKEQFLTIALQLDAYRKELTEWRKSSQFVTK